MYRAKQIRVYCVVILSVLILLGCSSSIPPEVTANSDPIATVNSEPIVNAEYALVQNIAALRGSGQKEQARDRLVRVKLTQLEGVQYDLLPSASYSSLLSRFHQENERRAQVIANKEVVYGPKQYTLENYYNDEFAQLELLLKKTLAERVMDLSEVTLRREYTEAKEDYIIQPTIELKVLKEPIHSNAKGARDRIEVVYQALRNNKSFIDLYNDRKFDATKAVQETITEENKRDYMKYREELFRQANKLQAGQYSNILIDQGNYVIVYCSNRLAEGYKSFEVVRDEVYLHAIDKQYQSYMDNLSTTAEVQWNAEVSH
ncbi:peptidylprolyl isomerase [Paenibacillus sp. FSL R10-2734]|uniref:peptidylprolyl isomerase n=1 Tax=Paenibacillus sp. FSL R10-2734 TaxID=2954691 RepID=UPI0030DD543C